MSTDFTETGDHGEPGDTEQATRQEPQPEHHDNGERENPVNGHREGQEKPRADPPDRGDEGPATAPYPIVGQYELDEPVKRGPLGLMKRRDHTDIPKIKPHEVLVWRVGERYVKDERQLRQRDDVVVRASSVSVVSVRPGTEVEVSFRIDSRDASEFTVKVIFICSVVDPVLVVKNGQVNASDTLLAYLRGYQDIFELGIEHPIAEINKVRMKMAIQVKAYMTHRPPLIPGMRIASATVQVETPTVLGKIREIDGELDIEYAKRRGEARNAAFWDSHLLAEASKISDAVGTDARGAAAYAHAQGGISGEEYANRLQQLSEAQTQRKQMIELADRSRRYELEDRRSEHDHDRELWNRKQVEDKREEARQDKRDQVSANLELLKLFADRGYLDTYNADIEDLIRRIRGEDKPGPEIAAGEPRAELPGGDEWQPEGEQ